MTGWNLPDGMRDDDPIFDDDTDEPEPGDDRDGSADYAPWIDDRCIGPVDPMGNTIR